MTGKACPPGMKGSKKGAPMPKPPAKPTGGKKGY